MSVLLTSVFLFLSSAISINATASTTDECRTFVSETTSQPVSRDKIDLGDYPSTILTERPSGLQSLQEQKRFPGTRYLTKATQLSDLNPVFSFADLATVSLKLLEFFPASKYFFVGIGRSPFPFLDMINLIEPNATVSIPISYNKYLGRKSFFGGPTPKEGLEPYTKSSPQTKAAFFQLLDQYLPSAEYIGDREIVILDFADYGISLAKFSVDLRNYLAENRRGTNTNIAFISAQPHSDQWYYYQIASEAMNTDEFDKLTKSYTPNHVGWWELRKHPSVLEKMSDYVPPFVNINLSGNLAKLAWVMDEEQFKIYAPVAHQNIDQQMKSLSRSQAAKHRLFQETMSIQFNYFYNTVPAFRGIIDKHRKQ